jgi:peptidoglycan hydrolase-like protein with peptidoglycan-binding domain
MDGILPERKADGRRFRLQFLTIALLALPCIGFTQSAIVSGSQSSATAVNFQILDQRSVSFGQHTVTLNRVAPPVFPAPVATPTPAPPQRYANYNVQLFWATVYDGKLTVLRYWNGQENMVAVTNINFDYVAGLYGFVEGDTFYQITAFVDDESSAGTDPETDGWLKEARKSLPPYVPGYVTVSGTASADVLQGLDALDVYFGTNKSALVQAYNQRQATFAAEALQLKLHPPVRPNTVINFWPIKSGVYPSGSQQ